MLKFSDNTIQTSAAGITRSTGTSIVNNLGGGNSSAAAVSLIGSGQNNVINGNADFGIILGGKNNTIENQSLNYSSSVPAPVNPGSHNFISSGEFNTIKPEANHAAIIGGRNNTIATGAVNSIILGGSNINATQPNTVYMQKATLTGLAGTGNRLLSVDANGNIGVNPNPLCSDCNGPPIDPGTLCHAFPSPGLKDGWHYPTDPTPTPCGITTMNWVGIGTYSPNSKLTIIGANSTNISSSLAVFNSSSNPLFLVRDDGNTGIGTLDPSARLEVRSKGSSNEMNAIFSEGTYRKLFIVPHLGGGGYNPLAQQDDMGIFWTDGQTGTGGQNLNAGLVLAASTGSSDGMRIGPDGIVTIGTPINGKGSFPNDNIKLSVNGVILSKEWIVNYTWCDFVFAPEYKRMSWKEKEIYFSQNRHMPQVDPEKEIAKDGLKVAKNLKGVVQNVEENSLDIIELYKMVEELKQENKKLKEQVSRLERK